MFGFFSKYTTVDDYYTLDEKSWVEFFWPALEPAGNCATYYVCLIDVHQASTQSQYYLLRRFIAVIFLFADAILVILRVLSGVIFNSGQFFWPN